MKFIILANGDINDVQSAKEDIKSGDFILACDGGLRHAVAMGITPDCLLGDMDSVPDVWRNHFKGKTITHPAEKDDTDLALAMTYALEMGATSIVVLGALGGRIDHQLANIHVLTMALQTGVPAVIKDEKTSIQVVDRSAVIAKNGYEFLSLIPLTTEVIGVTTQNLFFPLRGETLRVGTTRGVSNCFTENEAVITIKEGLLLLICGKF